MTKLGCLSLFINQIQHRMDNKQDIKLNDFIDKANGMTLTDLVELISVWSNIADNTETNIHDLIDRESELANIEEPLISILHNTANEMFM